MIKSLSTSFWLEALAIFIISLMAFLFYAQFPKGPSFDEFHYIPAAKQVLQNIDTKNWEHPPLAKIMIAQGLKLFGDRPFGWRFMSGLFGAITMVGTFFLAFFLMANQNKDLLKTQTQARWVTVVTGFNQIVYVQSRIAMLDTFMWAFMVWALVFLVLAWLEEGKKEQRISLYVFGALAGLAVACKWFGVFVIGAGLLCFVAVKLSRKYLTQKNESPYLEWNRPSAFSAIKPWHFILGFMIIPFLSYYITFLPYLGVERTPPQTLWGLISLQKIMFDGQLRVVNSHPYMSQWWQWPLLSRPIWYAFDKEGPGGQFVRGVICLGNPWVMWTGLFAFIYCLIDTFRTRRLLPFFVTVTYSVFTFSWLLIPRKISFYYYYYPSACILSFALAYLIYEVWQTVSTDNEAPAWVKFISYPWTYVTITIGFFLYFWPVLSGYKIESESFRNWMWFTGWI